MFKGIFETKMFILRKERFGKNLGPGENDEGVFCDQSQNLPREVVVNTEK